MHKGARVTEEGEGWEEKKVMKASKGCWGNSKSHSRHLPFQSAASWAPEENQSPTGTHRSLLCMYPDISGCGGNDRAYQGYQNEGREQFNKVRGTKLNR